MVSTLPLGSGESGGALASISTCFLELLRVKLPSYKLEELLLILQFSGIYLPQDRQFPNVN